MDKIQEIGWGCWRKPRFGDLGPSTAESRLSQAFLLGVLNRVYTLHIHTTRNPKMEVNGRWFSIHWSDDFSQKEHWLDFKKEPILRLESLASWNDATAMARPLHYPRSAERRIKNINEFQCVPGCFLNPGFNKWQVLHELIWSIFERFLFPFHALN